MPRLGRQRSIYFIRRSRLNVTIVLSYLTGNDDCSIEDIKDFRQLNAKTAGHPEYGHMKGIETTTGPLGQGITNSVGFALAERMLNARFGDNLVNHKTYGNSRRWLFNGRYITRSNNNGWTLEVI